MELGFVEDLHMLFHVNSGIVTVLPLFSMYIGEPGMEKHLLACLPTQRNGGFVQSKRSKPGNI